MSPGENGEMGEKQDSMDDAGEMLVCGGDGLGSGS
jgi:hypothetical protein